MHNRGQDIERRHPAESINQQLGHPGTDQQTGGNIQHPGVIDPRHQQHAKGIEDRTGDDRFGIAETICQPTGKNSNNAPAQILNCQRH